MGCTRYFSSPLRLHTRVLAGNVDVQAVSLTHRRHPYTGVLCQFSSQQFPTLVTPGPIAGILHPPNFNLPQKVG